MGSVDGRKLITHIVASEAPGPPSEQKKKKKKKSFFFF